MPEPTLTQWAAIDDALRTNRMIDAIRLFREATGASLPAARAALGTRTVGPMAELPSGGTADAPTIVRAYLTSGYAGSGELWAWWQAPSGDYCVLARSPAGYELAIFPNAVGSWGHQLQGRTVPELELLRALGTGAPLEGADWSRTPAVITLLRAKLAEAPAPSPDLSLQHVFSGTTVHRLAATPFERDWTPLSIQVSAARWASLCALAEQDQTEVLAADAFSERGDVVQLSDRAAPWLWAACLRECCVGSTSTVGQEHLFADLSSASHPSPDDALRLWWRMVDVAVEARTLLPWWLAAMGRTRSLHVGILVPADVQALARARPRLEPSLGARSNPRDVARLFDFLDQAASGGNWVIGTEPT